MQDRPNKTEILDALATFLMREVRPQVTDPALNFRVLIAANLASIVANEQRNEDTEDAAQLQRLRMLMPDVQINDQSASHAGRLGAIETLNYELVSRIRAGKINDTQRAGIWIHLGETLREKLAVVNPRFDSSPMVE
ncbi:MAG: hypothetical protein ACI9OJ_004906 [Myxococcota bacterium]|jgi:hypothetical protein